MDKLKTSSFRLIFLALIIFFIVYNFNFSKVGAQISCFHLPDQKIRVESGVISAPTLSDFEASLGVPCIGSDRAVIPEFALTSYAEMKGLYYDQADSSIRKNKLTGDQDQSAIHLAQYQLFWITKASPTDPNPNLTINSDIQVMTSGVIFVDGDLIITHDLTRDRPTTGLTFIVQGAIKIDPSVSTVNAFLISYNGFYSAWNGSSCTDTALNFLTINGSVISLNTASSPNFCRQKSTATQAAETINYQPKYLIILKDIFSRNLKTWREVQ